MVTWLTGYKVVTCETLIGHGQSVPPIPNHPSPPLLLHPYLARSHTTPEPVDFQPQVFIFILVTSGSADQLSSFPPGNLLLPPAARPPLPCPDSVKRRSRFRSFSVISESQDTTTTELVYLSLTSNTLLTLNTKNCFSLTYYIT